jgi:hypothetical protein
MLEWCKKIFLNYGLRKFMTLYDTWLCQIGRTYYLSLILDNPDVDSNHTQALFTSNYPLTDADRFYHKYVMMQENIIQKLN